MTASFGSPFEANPSVSCSKWYALHVRSRHEKSVADYLESNTTEFFLPTYRAVRLWKNGCRMQLDLPLFPGYLFVRIPLADRLTVLRCTGVVGIVGVADRPYAMEDSEIANLKAGLLQCAAEPYPLLAVGDRVRVHSGPFAGMEGVLVRKKNEFRVVLSIEVIAKSIAVELDLCNLESLPIRRAALDFAAGRRVGKVGIPEAYRGI